MKPVVITEYERIYFADSVVSQELRDGVWYVSRRLAERLRAFDEEYARRNRGITVFDWAARAYVKATSYVGVIQVPGLTVEILPKTDKDNNTEDSLVLAQNNLLYMLSLTKTIPVEERDLAGLERQQMPLLEALITIFVRKLLDELRKGLDHAYLHHEENLLVLKGKLLFNQQVRHNAAHRELVFISYDDFMTDTPLNRIFKTTCRCLLNVSKSAGAQKHLREAMAVLDEVCDCEITDHHFERIHLTRNNERFAPLLTFCRMVLLNQSPAPAAGKKEMFSLLFPMEQLFEEFIATVIQRHATFFFPEINRCAIHIQAKGKREYLMIREDTGKRHFMLIPDIIVGGDSGGKPRLILDTKWKRLQTSNENPKNGVSQADIYQLFAYAKHYGCRDNLLLYPKVREVGSAPYCLMTDKDTKIRIELIDLNRDLRRDQPAFLNELKTLLSRQQCQNLRDAIY